MTPRKPSSSNFGNVYQQQTGTSRRRTELTQKSQSRNSDMQNVKSASAYSSREEARKVNAVRQNKRKKKKIIKIVKIGAIALAVIAVAAAIILIVSANGKNKGSSKTASAETTTSASSETNTNPVGETENPSDPAAGQPTDAGEPVLLSTATIGASGDILTHNSVLYSAYNGDGTYDFKNHFSAISPYWSALDYMVVNLEVPCGGSEGEKGSQYPTFDAPDSLVSDLKNAGVDMFLTATNHTYDCRDDGLFHTQEVINSLGVDHIGTRLSTDDNFYVIKDINGIKFGMACYTYDTREEVTDDMSLNTIPLNDGSGDYVNSFCYSDAGLAELYSSVNNDLNAMKSAGCDVTVFFMHWGTEYVEGPSDFIRGIAQSLSDLGVDLIIGGHPHVLQPFEVLTGSGGNTTYCLYSTGNCLSSQRKEAMDPEEPRGYTEDGITISFTYDKYSDGSVKMRQVNVLPLWVDGTDYSIVPLDPAVDSSAWATYSPSEALDSYNRTEGRVGLTPGSTGF